MTHASRNTISGLEFEAQANIARTDGINISKKRFCSWVREYNINPLDYLSWKFEPDEAYFFPKTNEVIIYEKKKQSTPGSCDEKLGACGWKILEYKALCKAMNIEKVSYIYIFNNWFKQPRYEKLLKYIRSVEDCDYFFWE